MAKPSRAKVKKLQSEYMAAAAARRAEKSASKSAVTRGEFEHDPYSEVDQEWLSMVITASARRALINEGYYTISDLRKASLSALKELTGISPNVIRILVSEMKKQDIEFRSK